MSRAGQGRAAEATATHVLDTNRLRVVLDGLVRRVRQVAAGVPDLRVKNTRHGPEGGLRVPESSERDRQVLAVRRAHRLRELRAQRRGRAEGGGAERRHARVGSGARSREEGGEGTHPAAEGPVSGGDVLGPRAGRKGGRRVAPCLALASPLPLLADVRWPTTSCDGHHSRNHPHIRSGAAGVSLRAVRTERHAARVDQRGRTAPFPVAPVCWSDPARAGVPSTGRSRIFAVRGFALRAGCERS